MTLFQSLTTSIQHSYTKDPRCNSLSISYSGRCTKKKDRLLWISKITKTKVSLAFTAILQVHNMDHYTRLTFPRINGPIIHDIWDTLPSSIPPSGGAQDLVR